jgi:hypothetical protein
LPYLLRLQIRYILRSLLRFQIHYILRSSFTKILSAFLVSHILAICSAYLSLLNFTVISVLGDLHKLLSSLLCSIVNCSFISSLLGQDVFLSTLFSDNCNLCSYLKVVDHISHPYTEFSKLLFSVLIMRDLENRHY